jgi:hypothetical protein
MRPIASLPSSNHTCETKIGHTLSICEEMSERSQCLMKEREEYVRFMSLMVMLMRLIDGCEIFTG